MRCYLLFLPMRIKAYLMSLVWDFESCDKAEAFKFIVYKLKVLKFGLKMILMNDYHGT